jgi:hypothetical protein
MGHSEAQRTLNHDKKQKTENLQQTPFIKALSDHHSKRSNQKNQYLALPIITIK